VSDAFSRKKLTKVKVIIKKEKERKKSKRGQEKGKKKNRGEIKRAR
jgi:hypothetical protein